MIKICADYCLMSQWLYDQNFIPILLSCFDSHHSQSLQTAAGDFLKGVITLSANAAQTQEQCIGPNELTRQLVSDEHIAQLIRSMSVGGNPLTVGVGIVIEVIRKNNSDYDPEGVSSPNHPPTSRDPIYLGTVLRLFAKHIPNFMNLLKTSERIVAHPDGTQTKEPRQARFVAGERVEPLGFDRFKTCELMAELLHCSNMALLNEKGSEAYIRSRDEERVALKAAGKLLSRYAPPGPSDEFGDFQSAEAGDSTIEEFTHTEDDDFEEVGVSSDFRDMSASKDFEDEGVPLKSPFEDDGEFVDESFPPETSQSELRDPLHEEASPSELKEFDRLKIDEVDVRSDRRPSQTELQVASAAAAAASMEVHRPVSQSDNPGDTSRATTRSTDENEITSIDFAAEDEAVNHQSPERHASQSIADPSQHHGSPSKDHSDGSFGNSASSIDTTHGMDGESDRSQSPGPENYDYTIDVEDDGSPLVGDYLKMMFVEHDVVPIILDFFFAFPWNNFLHNVVYDVVQQVFNGPMVRGFNRQLAISLFTHGNITDRIVAGNKRNEEAEKNGNRRIGYMGHLTLIAEEIVKFTERNPPEMLTQDVMDKVMDPAWVDYVEITLAHTRERDNAVLGGERPDASIGARQSALAQGFALNAGASAALANAGIGAPPSPGLEPPTHFIENLGGPSEDDDDEDGGAMGGEEGHDEYRARDGDLNMSDAPIEPDDSVQMVILPPPPPLNVPTRARRQLAARLAQKRRELEAGGVAGSEGPSTGAGEVGTLSRRPGSFEEGAGDGAVGPFTMEPERGIQSGLDVSSPSD